jgi:hypothetical protein
MNIQKITENVPIFGTTGANAREHHKVTNLAAMANEGVNFDTYTIHEGEVLRFPKLEDLDVEWVAVRKGSKSGYNIIKCQSELNGKTKTTWFGLPALYKRDANNVAVNPSWYDLGNNLDRLKALCEMGEIRGESTVEIEVPVFDADGNRVYTDKFNPDGTPVLENGVQVTAPATKKQSVVLISEYVPA